MFVQSFLLELSGVSVNTKVYLYSTIKIGHIKFLRPIKWTAKSLKTDAKEKKTNDTKGTQEWKYEQQPQKNVNLFRFIYRHLVFLLSSFLEWKKKQNMNGRRFITCKQRNWFKYFVCYILKIIVSNKKKTATRFFVDYENATACFLLHFI